MVVSNGIRVFLFVSLAIFSAQALKVTLSNANRNFWYATEIIVGERDNHRTYNGKAIERHFPLQRRTTKVILYVVNSTRFSEIMKPQFDADRMKIAEDLRRKHYELLYLTVEDFRHQDEHIIREFILNTVRGFLPHFSINTIGDVRLEGNYVTPSLKTEKCFEDYKEDSEVCGGELKERLSSIKKLKLGELFKEE